MRQDRAERTRAKVLEATIDALCTCGYRGTSTQEVCRRAQVSRGTLLHHFPTRIDLLVGSLDYILADRVEQFVNTWSGGVVPLPDLMKALWAQWQGPVYAAWLELAVAARTEPALREPMALVMRRFDDSIRAAFADLVDLQGLPPQLVDAAPFVVFALFNGLSVGRSYEPEGHADEVVHALEQTLGLLGLGGVA